MTIAFHWAVRIGAGSLAIARPPGTVSIAKGSARPFGHRSRSRGCARPTHDILGSRPGTAIGSGSSEKYSNRPEPRRKLVEAAEPIRRPFLDHLDDQVVKFGSDQLVMAGQRQRPFAQMLLEQLLRGIGAEWRAATDQFITGDPETVNIGRRRRRLASDLFGGNIRLRSLARNLALEHLEDAGRHPSRQGVVDHPDFARPVEQDVLGFHVAVNPALIMHVRKRRRGLLDDPVQERLGQRIDRRPGDRQLEMIAGEEFHHKIRLSRVFDELD